MAIRKVLNLHFIFQTIPKIQFHLTQSNESSNKFTVRTDLPPKFGKNRNLKSTQTAAPSQSSSADAIKDFSMRPNIRSSDVKRHPAPQAFEVMKYVVQLIREDRDKRVRVSLSPAWWRIPCPILKACSID